MKTMIVVLAAFIAVTFASYPPMEDPNLFEGDMILDPDQLNDIRNGNVNGDVPLAATKTKLWPRTIPFDYHELKGIQNGTYVIDQAIKAFEKHTCLRFIRRTTEPGYLKFYNVLSCSTEVGYNKRGPRRVNFGRYCWNTRTAIHEIMHVLGFYHEHTRPDRNQFIKIHWRNLSSSASTRNQFRKRRNSTIDSLGVPYDYLSVLHYTKTAFSNNGKITIETLDKSMKDIIGKNPGLSQGDILQINRLYRCNGSK